MRRAEATPVNIDCLAQTVKDSGLPYAAGKDYEVGDIVSFFYTASPWEDVPHFCLVQAVYGVVYKKGVDKRGNVVEVPFNRRLELAQEVESHIEKLPPLEQSLLKREFGFEGDKESLGKIGEELIS
ncbi:MAG: hypothetical protein M1450_00675 [Patescibacteria group bacterium]|nr:hypothetical protein [Patescibacteria group bacterium]